MRKNHKFIVVLLCIFLINLPISSVHSITEKTGNQHLTVDNFIPTTQEWQRIGADYQIDSNDNDTSYIRFQWPHIDEVKYLSYFTFQNLEFARRYRINITSVLNVTVYYHYRVEIPGEWFRFKGYWYNGSAWITDGGFATSVATWHTSSKNLTAILDTEEKLENVKLYFTNWGSPSYDDPGRITYVYLDIWFDYTESYIYPLRLTLGLLGLALMIASPSIGVREVLKNRNWPMIGGCMISFCIGYALVHAWLIP